MEDPNSRPAAARLINDVIEQHHRDMTEHRAGWSLSMKIYDALIRAGYLVAFGDHFKEEE